MNKKSFKSPERSSIGRFRLMILLLSGALLVQAGACAQIANPFGFEDNAIGGWAGTSSAETAMINSTVANTRTGNYSLKLTTTSTGTGNKNWYSTSPYLPSASGVYLHFIYWAKAQDAGTSVDASYRYASSAPPSGSGSSANASAGVAITTTGWTRVTNTVTTSSTRFYHPGPRKIISAGATAFYLDDGILFTSSNAVIDTLAPSGPASLAGTVSGSLVNLTWASNTDGGTGATGVAATLLLRTSNLLAAAPVLNDQAAYSVTGGSAGPNTIGDWTVISDNTSPTATSYLDITATAGTVKYAVVLRDLAHNYSTTAVSPNITVGVPVPTILVDTVGFAASFGTRIRGTLSPESHYEVRGINLSGGILVTAPANFEISTTSGTGFGTTLNLTPTTGIVPATNIYVRFAPAVASGLAAASIVHTSASATGKNVAVRGTSIDVEPTTAGSISFGIVRSTRVEVNLPTIGNGNRRIIVVGDGADVTYVPVDGQAPSGVNADYSAAAVQSSGDRIVYDGNGSGNNVVLVTGLTPNTTYYFAAFEYNVGTGSSQNYLPQSPVTAVARTADNDLDVTNTNAPGMAVTIYPNPSSGLLFVNAPANCKAQVRDVAGRMVIAQTIKGQLNLTNLADGLYTLTIVSKDGIALKHEKIILAK